MDDQTKSQLKQAYDNLPKQLKEVVLSESWQNEVKRIALKYDFDETKTSQLENEVTYVLVGLIPVKEFNQNLERELKLTSTQASIISASINEAVFKKVRESLEQIQQEFDKEDAEASQNDSESSETTSIPKAQTRTFDDVLEANEIKKENSTITKPDNSAEIARQKFEEDKKAVEQKINEEIKGEEEALKVEMEKTDSGIKALEVELAALPEEIGKKIENSEGLASVEEDLKALREMANNEHISEEGRNRAQEMLQQREEEAETARTEFEKNKNARLTEETARINQTLKELAQKKQELMVKKVELQKKKLERIAEEISKLPGAPVATPKQEEKPKLYVKMPEPDQEELSRESLLEAIENPSAFESV